MSSFAVGDTMELKFFCRQAEQIGMNIFHLVVNAVTGGTQTDQEIANALSLGFSVLYKQFMAADASYFGMQMARHVGTAYVPLTDSRSGSGAGTAGGMSLPRQAAGLCKLTTGGPGRKNRGRFYMPFPSSTYDSSGGLVSAPGVALIQQMGDSIRGPFLQTVPPTPLQDITLQAIIYHRTLDTFTRVTGAVARAVFATQRRRGSYGKPNADPF